MACCGLQAHAAGRRQQWRASMLAGPIEAIVWWVGPRRLQMQRPHPHPHPHGRRAAGEADGPSPSPLAGGVRCLSRDTQYVSTRCDKGEVAIDSAKQRRDATASIYSPTSGRRAARGSQAHVPAHSLHEPASRLTTDCRAAARARGEVSSRRTSRWASATSRRLDCPHAF